jgi:hypothetical protein
MSAKTHVFAGCSGLCIFCGLNQDSRSADGPCAHAPAHAANFITPPERVVLILTPLALRVAAARVEQQRRDNARKARLAPLRLS